VDIGWEPGVSVCVVLASGGYPEKPKTGVQITGVEEAGRMEGVEVFHAGTKRDEAGRLVTAGGRVLNVTAIGRDADEARRRAYAAVKCIRFEGMQVRSDIGTDVIG
jgi:phosphoribosylamine--glycine ligase